MTQNTMALQYQEVQDKIHTTCLNSDRDPNDIQLIWVSKTQPVEKILQSLSLGAIHLGENKVQEVLNKYPLSTEIEYKLHFIGHLQSNKVRKILPLAEYIHSVDSLKLLNRIENTCEELGLKRKVFLQVNTSGETSKSGFQPEDFLDKVKEIPLLKEVEIIGLMTIGTLSENLNEARRCFRELSNLLAGIQSISTSYPQLKAIKGLSMGMSSDFDVAIELGSHYIRIGTKLFGARNY